MRKDKSKLCESMKSLKSSLDLISEQLASAACQIAHLNDSNANNHYRKYSTDKSIPIKDEHIDNNNNNKSSSHMEEEDDSTYQANHPKTRPKSRLNNPVKTTPLKTRSHVRSSSKLTNHSLYLLPHIILISLFILTINCHNHNAVRAQAYDPNPAGSTSSGSSSPTVSESNPQPTTAATCFGGLQTFEKISMSSFENPSAPGSSSSSFGSGILVQQDDQALTSECVNLCRSQSNCLSFVIDYNKFECKSYATTQQELQQGFDSKYQSSRSVNNSSINGTDYQASASSLNFQHLLPSTSSNYFEKICLDGVANRNQFSDVCGQGRLWTIERVVDSFLDGYVEKEVTNVNNKDECSKLCIFETQFVCRSADFDQHSRLCRLSKEDRRTQPQAMRYVAGSNRQYLENQCATPGPSSCVYETKKNVGIISMDALKFAQTAQDCQMKCNQEATFNCRSYSFHQQRCFLSGDDSASLDSNLIKLPVKQGWSFGEKKCLVELCTKGIFSYEKITGFTLRSALSTSIDLMMPGASTLSLSSMGNNPEDMEKLQNESSQTKLRHLLPTIYPGMSSNTSSIVYTMMMMAANNNPSDPMHESASNTRQHRSSSNLAITEHCRHSCDLGYLNCPAFTIDYRNNRCQRLDRNSQGRHHELVARDGFAYYEKICLRVPEIMSMCQDKYWIFERVIGYELAPRLYDKLLKFVQSRRDCEEYCLEEKQFQCRSALYNDETSDCRLSRLDRRLASKDGGYYRNFNIRISYLENQCIRDHGIEKKQCQYEQARDEPAYPTFTEHIEMVPTPKPSTEIEGSNQLSSNTSMSPRHGSAYCEQLCNDNAKFECHSFGYYSSTAQCFLSGDDTMSAGESATTPSTGFTYFEKKCKLGPADETPVDEPQGGGGGGGGGYGGSVPTTARPTTPNPYLNPNPNGNNMFSNTTILPIDMPRPTISNNNISIHIDQNVNFDQTKPKPSTTDQPHDLSSVDPNQYKCGQGHSFVYQRISGFEPVGGYLTLLVKNNEQPGIVSECAELCKRAYECRAFVVDYTNNQCFAMLENSSVGMLSLRQSLGKDYFEGFCVADHILLTGTHCKNKTWVMDKIVDQAVIGVQFQKLIPDSDRIQCRQACLEERLFWCKSAMFDGASGDCKLYSIDRESISQMRLLFTKGVDFFENQCQIVSSSCPYDAIERDMTIITTTKSIQARSTFDCENACNNEDGFNCRSYTYLEQYPSLPNLCLLSADSRSTSQRGSVKEHPRTLYAERNCYYRRPRYPGGAGPHHDPGYTNVQPPVEPVSPMDPYQLPGGSQTHTGHSSYEKYAPSKNTEIEINNGSPIEAPGQGCEPHQYTFERTFGYDYRLAQKERAPIAPTIGISIACQQECLRRGDRCQSFVVEYALPYQSCFLIATQVGANKKLLVKSPNSAYFEKVCLPRNRAEPEPVTLGHLHAGGNQYDPQSMDISPSYSNEPWTPQVPNQLPYYLQQQQLSQSYPSLSCAKLWSFERFVNHNFTVASDKSIENSLTRAHCETSCLNEASFSCRSATYDYNKKHCRLFKNTRRTIMSQFVDLESHTSSVIGTSLTSSGPLKDSHAGTAHVLASDLDSMQTAGTGNLVPTLNKNARQVAAVSSTAEPSNLDVNIDYLENTCTPEPSSCQYRQVYDQLSLYIDKINHAVSLSDCQRQCDLERLFSCKAVNYDPTTKNCMLLNEDLVSLNRGQQASLIPKKGTIYSEKGNCEMVSVQCNSQEMLVSINFDSPFKGRVMAKGNPEQCFIVGDGQTNMQFPIVFGPKCNSRQEGHNTFVNEIVIQQHPVIMTDNDKTVRVMCAFEAPDQTITLKNPTSRDNKTGIDVGTPESSRTRHDKPQFNSVVSNKASPPSVLLRILDPSGRDASMINLGDDLILRIQMQMDGQNSALGIFARNLAARSSNGESLLLIDNDGCPVDPQVFPALEVDTKDGKSLQSTFKAFRFPSSGLVNFEVQIRFCPDKCQPVDCHRGKMKSFGRKKRDTFDNDNPQIGRTPVIQSIPPNRRADKNPLDAISTVMKPGKAFQYVRELLLVPQSQDEARREATVPTDISIENEESPSMGGNQRQFEQTTSDNKDSYPPSHGPSDEFDSQNIKPEVESNGSSVTDSPDIKKSAIHNEEISGMDQGNVPSIVQPNIQKSILMHVDEKVVPSSGYPNGRGLSQQHSSAPYGRFPIADIEMHHRRQTLPPTSLISSASSDSFNPPSSSNGITEAPQSDLDMKKFSDDQNPDLQSERGDPSPASPTEQPLMEHDNYDGTTTVMKNEETEKPSSRGVQTTAGSELDTRSKDLPLRFSILVGDNQAPSNGWTPVGQPSVLVMNSTNVDLDHIVIPGKEGQFNHADEPKTDLHSESIRNNPLSAVISNNDLDRKPGVSANEVPIRTQSLEQSIDTSASNSVAAEIQVSQTSSRFEHANRGNKDSQPSETAASHDCQVEAGRNKLRTIIWTGSFVIALNLCLVIISLLLYFKKVHLRKNHDMVRASSECGTQSSISGLRWPSVLLKSKNNLGTSLNTHEHFFCKLNSKPGGSGAGMNQHDYNWPNFSARSPNSTISSLASPIGKVELGTRKDKIRNALPFEGQPPTRGNFTTGHRSVLDLNSYQSGSIHASYTNNIDEEPDSDKFQGLM